MNGPAITPSPAALRPAINGGGGGGGGGGQNMQSQADVNSQRIGLVAEGLAQCAQSSGQINEAQFFQLCLSLARGIDYAIAKNEVPAQASILPSALKQVCRRKNEFFLKAAIMVLMISVKNACKLRWFTAKDTEELLILANEIGSYFCTTGDINIEETDFLPTVSNIMSRFYPQLKLGHIFASIEVKPGYGTYVLDFTISKNLSYSQQEKVRLFVAMKDKTDTSSCIITPQQANILINGKGVERRTNVLMDQGPQLPTIVNPLLKYGTNLLQAVGQFNGNYVILIAFMSEIPDSDLPAPQDYVQPDTTALSSGSDSEIFEGPSRISLNCPISQARIATPVKGHLCKHYQCFDLSFYVKINSKRPSWRCPHCNQSVGYTDIRVDQKMVKVLQEVGENVTEVIIFEDGSWTAASSSNQKDESCDKFSANQQESHEPQQSCNVYDLTKENDEMDIADRCEMVDVKPLINQNVQGQSIPTNSTLLPIQGQSIPTNSTLLPIQGQSIPTNSTLPQIPRNMNEVGQSIHTNSTLLPIQGQPLPTNSTLPQIPRSMNEVGQSSSSQFANFTSPESLLYDPGTTSYNNMRPETQIISGISGSQTSNFGISPVLTDAISPALNRLPDNFQGTNYPIIPVTVGQFSAASMQFQELLYQQSIMGNDSGSVRSIPRNVHRTPSAIQALPVQSPTTPNTHLHSRPTMNTPVASGSSVPYRVPSLPSNGSNIERQRHFQQSHVNPLNISNTASTSLHNRPPPQVMGLSTPPHNLNARMGQTLSQPPHLMRSSQLPRSQLLQGVPQGAVSNPQTMVQRVQFAPLQVSQMRQQQTPPHQTPPHQTDSRRMTSSVPVNPQGVRPPQAVSRTENLIDLQSEQNWRPTGRMRGSLTGPALSAAMNQIMGQATQSPQGPSPRPPIPTLTHRARIIMDQMNARSQGQNHPVTDTRPGGPL